MGTAVDFFSRDEKGRREEYTPLAPSKIVNGVKGTLLKKVGDKDTHTSLPYYSNTSEVYFRQNKNGVCQARVYVGNKTYLDFDWSHNHTNKDSSRTFKAGRVHVQVWVERPDGSFLRTSDSARSMSNAEMKKYGPILKAFCPYVKLR